MNGYTVTGTTKQRLDGKWYAEVLVPNGIVYHSPDFSSEGRAEEALILGVETAATALGGEITARHYNGVKMVSS